MNNVETETEQECYLLEERQAFAQSRLWELQRRYFSARGSEAWRQNEVPDYVTSNPTIAHNYAEIVFAFYQDRQRLQACDEPFTICELGAGAGRFAFHFLRHLSTLCMESDVPLSRFHYVMTDFTQTNVTAWRQHPRLQSWFTSGLLDVALFDVNSSEQLHLQISAKVLTLATLKTPLIVLANYVFDGVPQDLIYLNDGIAQQGTVSLTSLQNPEELDVGTLLAQIHVHYHFQDFLESSYPEPELRTLLRQYRSTKSEAYMLFPSTSLRCLERLRSLSSAGLLLLTADKGQHQIEHIFHSAPPTLSLHGSFSVSVNYHAFLAWCDAKNGLGLHPQHQHQSIDVIALLLVDESNAHYATRRAYRERIEQFGPDDFFTLSKTIYGQIPTLSFAEIIAYMRFSRFDAHQLARMMPRLMALASDLSGADHIDLKQMLDQTWDAYFPLGEGRDLAFDIACLLYELNDFRSALPYFANAQAIYGFDTGSMFNMAACYQQLEQFPQARLLLDKVLKAEPENIAARTMWEQIHIVEHTKMTDF